MHPKCMQWMAEQLPKGRYLYCPNGSHFALYDDQKTYMHGIITFIEDVDAGRLDTKP
jgi:proline iminopeptidase